jgi:hypothetical protein
LGVLAIGLPSFAEDAATQPAEVTNTERLDFAAGGLIRLNTPSGNLMVEAWDRPEVEWTTVKSTRHAAQCLDRVHVEKQQPSAKELVISTTKPKTHLWGDTCGVNIEQQVRVPRESRLVIRHGAGYVYISRVIGDIDATSRSGDIFLMLPDPGPYAIDAKSKFGNVSSDFAGSAHHISLMGERFASASAPSSHRIYLRMGLGGITIKEVPATPEAPMPADKP